MSDRRECDVLVLGAGVAGLATALAAALQGLRVIVAEKSAHFGGTAAISAGWAWVPGNPKGAAATGDTREEVETYLKALAPDTYDAPRVALGGSDHRTYTVAVKPGVRSLGVVLAHPSLNQVGVNGFEYVVTVKDATGRVVGTTTENPSVGTSSVLVDGVRAGTYTVEVEGRAAVSDPDTLDSDSVLGDTITLQLAQLR